jgi:hypothetical protein
LEGLHFLLLELLLDLRLDFVKRGQLGLADRGSQAQAQRVELAGATPSIVI